MKNKVYLCIDLKSFYASVECAERDLDPMKTNLVVADPSRTDKTICLAVSPAMKALGVRNRCRVFEIPKNIEYIMAEPRMQKYIDYAAEIYGIYLKYMAKEDIYVYSIDEVFLDITGYLKKYGMCARQMAVMLMNDIYDTLGVPSACGIGTNLYLTKIALDITAKHSPDFIGYLDQNLYKKTLWDHKPITDFWRVGAGTAKRLEKYGIETMGDIARCNEALLYRLFGVDAELLIDHANGIEPVTIADIKAYRPRTNCLASGQVLMRDYGCDEARIIVSEMTDALCLELVEKGLVTQSVTLHIGYSNAEDVPPSHATVQIERETSSDNLLRPRVCSLYDKTVNRHAPIRRINITFNKVTPKGDAQQLSFFEEEDKSIEKHETIQKAVIDIKKKYGNNSILKGMNLKEGATAKERNMQIGGHKSGN